MKKHLGPIALAAGLVGIISGGVWAGAHAFAPIAKPAPVVQLVQPAAQVVTPIATTTTTATVAPKPVAPKPVQSVKAKAPAVVAPVQRQAAVTADPTPVDTTPASQAPAPQLPGAPLPHDEAPGSTPGQTGVFGGGVPSPTSTK